MRLINLIIVLLIGLLLIGQASAGSIIVTDIDISGYSNNEATDFVGTTMYVGDSATNLVQRSQLKFNLTNQSANISAVRNNITSVRLWVYQTVIYGSPLFGLKARYVYNDTWTTAQKGALLGTYNVTDMIMQPQLNNSMWQYFQVKNAWKADNDNLSSFEIFPISDPFNSVDNVYGFNTHRASSNKPYLEFVYDNTLYNGTHYRNMSEIDWHIDVNGSDYISQGFWLAMILGTTDGSIFLYTVSDHIFVAAKYNATLDTVDSVNQSSKQLSDYKYQSVSGIAIDNTSTSENILWITTQNPSLNNSLQELDKRFYITNLSSGDNINIAAAEGYLAHFYNNGSSVPVSPNNNLVGSENFYNVTSGTIKHNNTYYTINKTYMMEQEDVFYSFENFVWTWKNATSEMYFTFDSDAARGVFWMWQVGNVVFKRGSIYLKDSNEYIPFEDTEMAAHFANSNKTVYSECVQTRILPFNYIFYANSSKGYLVLSLPLFAELRPDFTQHQFRTVTGTWTYSNGTNVNITDGWAVSESNTPRLNDIIDSVNNSWLIDNRIEGDIYYSNISVLNTYNFTVRGNNVHNISVDIYNSTKLYNSTQIRITNNLSNESTRYNNLSMLGNGTYTIKSLNVSLNSSASVIVIVNSYNSTIFAFTATNSTVGQTMNVTVNNDVFPVTNGHFYHIKKDGISQQTMVASGNSITFTNINVGSDYVIEDVPGIDVYAYNSTSNDYTNYTSYSVQPNQGILVYSPINFTWIRSTI